MAQFPARAVKEICKKPARLFAHAVVFGLAALQFGCASVKGHSSEPSLPPETQAAIMQGIARSTKGMPVRVMTIDKYNEMEKILTDTLQDMRKAAKEQPTEQDTAEAEKKKEESSKNIKAFILSNSKPIFNSIGQNDLVMDYDFMLEGAHLADNERVTAKACKLGGEPKYTRLLVVDDFDNPLEPSSLEKNFFKHTLGIPELDEVFGEEFQRDLRAYVVWHEAVHIGDTRELPSGRIGSVETEVGDLMAEGLADTDSLEGFCKLTGKVEFARIIMHNRALNALVRKRVDAVHATQSDIAELLKKLGSPEEEYPDMNEEEVVLATREIRYGKKNAWVDKPFWKPLEEIERESALVQYKALAGIMQNNDLTAYQREHLEKPKVREILYTAWKAWEYFNQKLEAAGRKWPVPLPEFNPPSQPTRDNDVKYASPVAAGPT